jgi:hypothetical protein
MISVLIYIGLGVWFVFITLLVRSINTDPKDKYGGHI